MPRKKAEVTEEVKEEVKEEKPKKTVSRKKKEPLTQQQELAKAVKMEKEGLSEKEAEAEVREQDGSVIVDVKDIISGEEILDSIESEAAETEETAAEEAAADEKKAPKKKHIASDTDIFHGRRVKTATDPMRRGIYRNEYYVNTAEASEEVITKKDRRKNEFNILAQAANSLRTSRPTILKGILIGVEEKAGIAVAEIEYGGYWNGAEDDPFEFFHIYIPLSMMFAMEDPESYAKNTMKIYNGLLGLATRRVGMPVEFLVMRVVENEGVAFGSRIHALSQISTLNYRSKQTFFTKGAVVQGTITGVTRAGVWFNAAGAESYIPMNELSWNRISDCTDEYTVGQTLQAKIMDITPVKRKRVFVGDTITLSYVDVTFSVKATDENPQAKYFDSVKLKDVYLGTVTQKNENGIFVHINKNNLQVFCNPPQLKRVPAVEDKVVVQIDRLVPEAKKIFANIISFA